MVFKDGFLTNLWRLFSFFLFSVFFIVSPIHASTEVFLPTSGFLRPETFDGLGENRSSSKVFGNASLLTQASGEEVKIQHSSDYFGYSRSSVTYVYPVEQFTLGVGYSLFSASDLIRTSEDDNSNYGVSVGGNFTDKYEQASLSFGYQSSDTLRIGGMIRYYSRLLDSASARAGSLDVGMSWTMSAYPATFGLYSRHLLSTQLEWQNSGYKENLDRALVVEAHYKWRDHQAFLAFDDTFYKLYAEAGLTQMFSVLADVVVDYDDGVTRYSFGALLHIQDISLQYTRLIFADSDLDVSQDLLGFNIQLN